MPKPIELLADMHEIQAVVDGIDNSVDVKDWEHCLSLFTEHVHIDFSSLGGGAPTVIPAAALVASWRTNLHPGKSSFHMRTNHEINLDGDQAWVFSKGSGYNKLGEDLWEFWGTYEHTLVRTPWGWKCSAMVFTLTHTRGSDAVRLG